MKRMNWFLLVAFATVLAVSSVFAADGVERRGPVKVSDGYILYPGILLQDSGPDGVESLRGAVSVADVTPTEMDRLWEEFIKLGEGDQYLLFREGLFRKGTAESHEWVFVPLWSTRGIGSGGITQVRLMAEHFNGYRIVKKVSADEAADDAAAAERKETTGLNRWQ